MDKLFGAKRSKDWSKTRKAWLKENPNCAVCNKPAKTPHHKNPFHLFPKEELNLKNLITLCSIHHLHFGHLGNYASYNKNIEEDSKIWNKKYKERP